MNVKKEILIASTTFSCVWALFFFVVLKQIENAGTMIEENGGTGLRSSREFKSNVNKHSRR